MEHDLKAPLWTNARDLKRSGVRELSQEPAISSGALNVWPTVMEVVSTQEQLSPRLAPPVPRIADSPLDLADQSLLELGRALKCSEYRFTTITPSSHARVASRRSGRAASLADVFGWNLRFHPALLVGPFAELARTAGILESRGTLFQSSVRFSTLGSQLYVHSAYPTDQADAVFFGPDTYRFARVISGAIARMKNYRLRGLRILDVGAGSGAGGLHAAALTAGIRPTVTLTDINRRALRYCRVNAALNDVDQVELVESDLFANVSDAYDLIIANPPYLIDKQRRTYRHGGGHLGSGLSVRFVEEGIHHLTPGGRLILYTGSTIVGGRDYLHETLVARLNGSGFRMTYEEIDPDVFGEELDRPPYDRADRIAVVSVAVDAPEGDAHAPRTS